MHLNIFIHLVIMLCNSVRYQYAEREIDENKKRERWSAKRIGARVRDEGRAVYLWYNLWMAQPRYTANLDAPFSILK